MKQRIGLILALAGVILLIEPNLNWELLGQNIGAWAIQYWPVFLILLGALLINPHKKKKRSAR